MFDFGSLNIYDILFYFFWKKETNMIIVQKKDILCFGQTDKWVTENTLNYIY